VMNSILDSLALTLFLPQNQILSIFRNHSAHEVSLLLSFLRYSPAARITAEDALQHAYFDSGSKLTNKFSCNFISDVSSFESLGKSVLVSVCLSIDMWCLVPSSNMALRQYMYLRHLEKSSSYVSKPMNATDVLAFCPHRLELADYLVDIMDTIPHHMCVRTVFFAMAIFDRYLAQSDRTQAELVPEYELIGSTCLHIASKCEDVSYISVKDLAAASHNM
jgi:serine/threonine protein kinase